MLGYLNFSLGKPDPRFQQQLNDAYLYFAGQGAAEPWRAMTDGLKERLSSLEKEEAPAFRDATQARAVIRIVFDLLLPAYRAHHRDLLAELPDQDLYASYFLVRAFEAVLAQAGPWDEEDRIVTGALSRLNDYVGHRPIAILETRPKGEPYPHERVRPIPLYIRSAGVAYGRYRELVARTLDILSGTKPDILAEAQFDPTRLDELALDPRPYDQGHPAHRRPNYIFGEWDPDLIDNQGYYRRFVLRQVVLDALLDRVAAGGEEKADADLLFEAAVVLAATILMASGIRGSGPEAYDSTTTLSTLMPRIARYRDEFYRCMLDLVAGPHGERLRQEAGVAKQPFAAARQHLNDYLAAQRARQVQHRHLALLFAAMGYPDAGRQEASQIPVAAVRMLSSIHAQIATGFMATQKGDLENAMKLLSDIEGLIKRGIDCGALADPWHILGFQALFPLSAAREDSVRDTRIDDLMFAVERFLHLHAELMSEAAAIGNKSIVNKTKLALRRTATWWDQFASTEVSDVRRVHGGETAASAEHVAAALGRWHAQGEATGDLAFWKRHLDGFRSPRAFAAVIQALLDRKDYRAAMALLINWVGHTEQTPLEDGPHSFHALALRWILAVTAEQSANEHAELVPKFFDYLEANAGDYWDVPSLEAEPLPMPQEAADDDDLFGAAYEGVTYQDTTDDGAEGAVWEGEPRKEFILEAEAEPIGKRLRFLSTLAQLWQIAVRHRKEESGNKEIEETIANWSATAADNMRKLLALLDSLQAHPVPEPSGSHDSMVDYDRRRILKEQLLYTTIGTALDTGLAMGALRGAAGPPPPVKEKQTVKTPGWEAIAIRLEAALWSGDAEQARSLLPLFVEQFRSETLLFTALADGGSPRLILRARLAQSVLRALIVSLPRLGLLRETHHLLQTARSMEAANPPQGRGVSEFNSLFHMGLTAVIEAVTDAAADMPDNDLAAVLEQVTGKFLKTWTDYSQSLHLSALERVRTAKDWQELLAFVRKYGGDLFHARFLTLANLRGILHRGVGPYLDYLIDNPDPLRPVRLVNDLDQTITRSKAEWLLGTVLNALVENYEEYKDYNSTTAQSDYGENLFMLLDFLRLKAAYERQAWLFRPLALAHEVLARKGRTEAAVLWEHAFARLAGPVAGRYQQELRRLEQAHGIRIRTIADRLGESFVQPLVIDRLCALIRHAMTEAPSDDRPAFARFQQLLSEQTARPAGAGLDVPDWIRRLEAEVHLVQAKRSAINVLAEQQLRVPARVLSIAELNQQLQSWNADTGP
jgi:hypothetical protein